MASAHPNPVASAHPNLGALASRLTVMSIVGYFVAVSLLFGFAYWSAATVDSRSLLQQTNFVSSGVTQILDRVPVEQESFTLWDDAVLKARDLDQAWMEENIGKWVGDYFSHDEVYVLNERDQPIHAMRENATVEAALYFEKAELIRPFVDRLRERMDAESRGLTDVSATVGSMGESGLVLDGEIPVGISVKPIVAFTAAVEVKPNEEYLHIAIRRVDADLLEEVSKIYNISGLKVLPMIGAEGHGPMVPLEDAEGRYLAFLNWNPDRPGTALIWQAMPGLGAACVLGLILISTLVFRVRSAATELQASEAQTRFLAFHDTLTGVPNRALFEDRLDRALVQAGMAQSFVALHLIDIDRFKLINDTRGHGAGDTIIRAVAVRLAAALRPTDTLARLGGDEFAIVQMNVTLIGDAEDLGYRLLRSMDEPFEVDGAKIQVNASAGIVTSHGGQTTRQEMLRKADIALYEAKARGRGRYQLFEGDMDDVVKRRRLVEEELRLALELGSQIEVLYQPVFAPNGRTILGAEALVRWDHPEQGRMSPDIFISIAEERGLIGMLGQHVLREAATFAVTTDLPWVAVNVSPFQFQENNFAERVLSVLQDVGLPPQRLQLEITEGVLLENAVSVNSCLQTLRAAGVRVALDDFGTGYSSMNYLRNYSIDKLKIDRSFIAELGTSKDADAIVRSMITLGRAFRLQITAEGVETPAQLDHLAALGCHEIQGFLLSKPISGTELKTLLADRISLRGLGRDGTRVVG